MIKMTCGEEKGCKTIQIRGGGSKLDLREFIEDIRYRLENTSDDIGWNLEWGDEDTEFSLGIHQNDPGEGDTEFYQLEGFLYEEVRWHND